MAKMTSTLAMSLLPPEDADELRKIDKRLAKLNDECLALYDRKWQLFESVRPLGERQRFKTKEENN